MSYIKQERNREIKKLPLLEDIINKIINYNDEFIRIDSCIDSFWINFGKETCNLIRWSWYCFDILARSFGKTNFMFLYDMDKYFKDLRSILYGIFCSNYPKNITSIQNVPILTIFYSNYDIIEYPMKDIDIYRKYITKDERKYIMTFIKRINVYFKYIENNIDIFSINLKFYYSTIEEIADKKKDIIKTISKIETKSNKLTMMMNDIKVKEK